MTFESVDSSLSAWPNNEEKNILKKILSITTTTPLINYNKNAGRWAEKFINVFKMSKMEFFQITKRRHPTFFANKVLAYFLQYK